jgi:hypothetical protein
MASSIVHLAITNELIKRYSFRDVHRLKYGSVIVDAGYNGNSHLKINVFDGQKKTYDFDSFRQMFGEKMREDDFYLGYYLHLVQDVLYRRFVYDKYHWNPKIPGNVERLHRDYAIVNGYIIKKYNLVNDLLIPENFSEEIINNLCSFDAEDFRKRMDSYFIPIEEQDIFFFTREMSDEFIGEAIDLCLHEIKCLEKNESGIDMYEYAWTRLF